MPRSKEIPLVKKFGANLRAAREAAGLSQGELAEMVGLHQTFIGKLEGGVNDIRLAVAVALAEALQISLDKLIRD
jgi:transcriptional regulator with XRE-family HTH domain